MTSLKAMHFVAELSLRYDSFQKLRSYASRLNSLADDEYLLGFFLLMVDSTTKFESAQFSGCFSAVSCAKDALRFVPMDDIHINLFNSVLFHCASAHPCSEELASTLCNIYKQIIPIGEHRLHEFESAIVKIHSLLDMHSFLGQLSEISGEMSERITSKMLCMQLDGLMDENQHFAIDYSADSEANLLCFGL
jgi:hypothetical protein